MYNKKRRNPTLPGKKGGKAEPSGISACPNLVCKEAHVAPGDTALCSSDTNWAVVTVNPCFPHGAIRATVILAQLGTLKTGKLML